MGDRANIYLVDTEDAEHGIYLYTHWTGSEWPEQLRRALEHGQGRWGDPQYLNRIICSQVFAGIHDGLTGGGIGTEIGDNGHPIIVCDTLNQTVAFAPEGEEKDRWAWAQMRSFTDYVAQQEATYPEEAWR